MQIKVFTMVKDEEDIVSDWVIYHGSLFGFHNIYIIDNFSTDGTYEKLLEFKKTGVNISQEQDYKKKGDFMLKFLNNYCANNDIGYPIDIDEFIVFYDKDSKVISIDKYTILNCLHSLPDAPLYKTNYIIAYPSDSLGYSRATTDCKWGNYSDYGPTAKSFMKRNLFQGTIDHGNHINSNSYYLTNLCLVHFHIRNLDQIKKKIYNNVNGLGYHANDVNCLKGLMKSTPNCNGNHHVKSQIMILENNYSFPYFNYKTNMMIDLSPLNQCIKDGYF